MGKYFVVLVLFFIVCYGRLTEGKQKVFGKVLNKTLDKEKQECINQEFDYEKSGDIVEKSMVIIIPSYNNKSWHTINLDSVLSQHYARYKIIYIDDCSPDGTGALVEKYKAQYDKDNRITLIKNSARLGAMANIYHAVHACDDQDIIIILDGDDWFAHDQVLSILNNAYADTHVWITYGNYREYPSNKMGICCPIPIDIIATNAYRDYSWVTSHVRTFYAWLFKRIQKEDFLYDGEFLTMTCDLAIMFPLLEMAGGRFKFITDIVYIYNRQTLINDDKINRILQKQMGSYIRLKERYKPLEPIMDIETVDCVYNRA